MSQDEEREGFIEPASESRMTQVPNASFLQYDGTTGAKGAIQAVDASKNAANMSVSEHLYMATMAKNKVMQA